MVTVCQRQTTGYGHGHQGYGHCKEVTQECHVAEEDPCVDVESEESVLYRSLASNYSSNLYNNNNSRNN